MDGGETIMSDQEVRQAIEAALKRFPSQPLAEAASHLLEVLGYTSQGRFLLNCGLLDDLGNASLAERSMAQKLVNEHEMGELFKVIAFGAKNTPAWEPMGFSAGDRMHTL